VAPCARCGTFLCGACTEVMDEAAYCADCLGWLRNNALPSRVVKGAIALNVIAILAYPLCLIFPPALNLGVGVFGLWVATRELRRIREGEGPLRGTWQARVALGLGALNLLLAMAWIALFLYAMSLGATS
jgi:hypothetical protein